ncbi:MAG: glycosyltransferase family 2 protein [Verrucomicrobiota bacterium]
MKPEVSIIIPCYNAAPWLEACIASTRAQGVDSMELIIIDDGSTDGSLKIVKSMADDNLHLYSQSNRGASSARNRGLAVSRGRYIQYLDADDQLGKYKILHQLHRLREAEPGSVATCPWVRFDNKPLAPSFHHQKNFQSLSPLEFLQVNWEQDIMMHPAAWLIPRSVAEQAGPWDESLTLNDDGEYFCRVVLESSGLVYTPDAASYYRSNLSSSLSGRKDPDSLLSLHSSIEKMEALMLEHDHSPRTEHACACARQRLAYSIFLQHPELAAQCETRAQQMAHGPLPEPGGRITQVFAQFTGWRTALQIQRQYHRLLEAVTG